MALNKNLSWKSGAKALKYLSSQHLWVAIKNPKKSKLLRSKSWQAALSL